MKIYARDLALVNGSRGFVVSRQPDFSIHKIVEVPRLSTLDQESLEKYLKEEAISALRVLDDEVELEIQLWENGTYK